MMGPEEVQHNFFDLAGTQGAKRVDLALTRKDWSTMTQFSSGLAAEHEPETGLGTHVLT